MRASARPVTSSGILVMTARSNGRIGLCFVALPETGQGAKQAIVGRVKSCNLLALCLNDALLVR